MSMAQRKVRRIDEDNVVKFPDPTDGDYEPSGLYALLMILPPEERDFDEKECGDWVRVVMVGQRDEMLSQAKDHQERHAAALAEWDAWDDTSKDWSEEHDAKFDEIGEKYDLSVSLVEGTQFKVVDVLDLSWPLKVAPDGG